MRAAAGRDEIGYDRLSRILHWAVAIMLAAVLGLGLAIAGSPRNSPARDLLLLLHRSIGLTILAAMMVRVAWRWRHPPPPEPATMARLERGMAHATHGALYALLLAMPLAGYVNAAAAGHAVSVFGLFAIPPLLPPSGRTAQIAIALHLLGQYVIYAFVALHVAGALMHALVRRDTVLERMLPPRETVRG